MSSEGNTSWTTPRGAAIAGLAAGAAGTAAMTGAQLAYMQSTGGESSGTPGAVGKRILEGVFQREVSADEEPTLNNVMHWVYGTSWGLVYGISGGARRRRALRSGLAFGLVVWGASLAELPAMKLGPPVWEYDAQALAPDLGFHLVYGIGAAVAYRVLKG
ncbi:MAG: hypothetical protein ACR2IP_11250 [Solirubrobacteraceae bacterium]